MPNHELPETLTPVDSPAGWANVEAAYATFDVPEPQPRWLVVLGGGAVTIAAVAALNWLASVSAVLP